MRTDGSFHGFFTLAPLPTAWFLMRRRRNGSARIFRRRKVRCGAKNLWKTAGSVGVKLSAQCAKEQAGCFYSPTDLSDKHRCHADCLYQKNTDCTDAHGWVFSRILYSCSAAHCLVFDAPPAQWIGTDFSQEEGALRSEKSVEIREICGRQLSAQCAKEQAGCFYSPTDLSDKHRCHADCLSITQIAPSARQIDTDFSQAENLSMRARFNGHAPKGQKFIAQGKRSDALGIMCCVACAL